MIPIWVSSDISGLWEDGSHRIFRKYALFSRDLSCGMYIPDISWGDHRKSLDPKAILNDASYLSSLLNLSLITIIHI